MNEEKITIWEERIHACQNSDLTVAAWCREHQMNNPASVSLLSGGRKPQIRY